MAAILVLEDSQVLLTKLTNELKQRFTDLQILPARSVAEAQLLLNEFEIDIFILDIFLPDGSGIDFLCDVKTINPESHAIIMTAQNVPDLKTQAEDIGVVRFFQKPIDTQSLFKVIQKILTPDPVKTDEHSPQSFVASLGGLSTVDIIQLKCLSRSTQVLKFTRSDGKSAKIYFQRGEIVHAETDTDRGLDAFNDVVSWKGGRVEESAEPIAEQTIKKGWESLLMDAVRMIDEAVAH
ncbi:MAG: response regulator [Blastochloris sp.]|jgi:DNA-binding response OmpR family regulator|nr:response regulator [Blastochloris sp.]